MKQILVNNCYDCPYRDANIGGKVPHYCKHPNIACRAVADVDFEEYCPLKELKTGHWILKRTFSTKLYDEYLNEYKCSECYREIRCTESQLVNYPYCHCGTKMVEQQESGIEKRKPCINHEDGCEEWAGCPCVHYKTENEE